MFVDSHLFLFIDSHSFGRIEEYVMVYSLYFLQRAKGILGSNSLQCTHVVIFGAR